MRFHFDPFRAAVLALAISALGRGGLIGAGAASLAASGAIGFAAGLRAFGDPVRERRAARPGTPA